MQLPVTFLFPWLLMLALAAVPILWLRRRRQSAIGHPQVGMHKNVRAISIFGWLPSIFLTLSMLAMAAAFARPVVPRINETRSIETRDIIIAVDISGSMSSSLPAPPAPAKDPASTATDYSPYRTYRRLDAARDATVEFVEARKIDRIGILVFDDDSYWHWPLSDDHKIVIRKAQLLNSYTGGGTNFEGPSDRARGTGPLQAAITHFRQYGKANAKVLVLVTDGEDSISQKRQDELAAQLAADGVKLYVLGVGEGWANGSTNDLQKFTEGLGGQVFRVGDKGALQAAFSAINELELSRITVEKNVSYSDLYDYFALASALFLVLFLGSSAFTREEA